jgi:hypothetical protein
MLKRPMFLNVTVAALMSRKKRLHLGMFAIAVVARVGLQRIPMNSLCSVDMALE